MQTKKMSLANIQGKLSRAEMKKIMAGSGGACADQCSGNCILSGGPCTVGTCSRNGAGQCFCSGAC